MFHFYFEKMKFLVLVVALATLEAVTGLKCYTCKQGEEGTDVCIDGPGTSKECLQAETESVNCYATEIRKNGERFVTKGCFGEMVKALPNDPIHPHTFKMHGCLKFKENEESEDGIFCLCDSDDCNSGEPQDMDDCPTTEAPPAGGIYCWSCDGDKGLCTSPEDNGELKHCPDTLTCFAIDVIDPSGNQMVARGCLPSDVPNDLRTTDVSHQGCFDLKDDAVGEGIYCLCNTSECNNGSPKSMDDCIKD